MRISSKGRVGIGIVGLLAVAGLVVWWALQQGRLPTLPTAITQTSNPGANPGAGHGTNGSETQASTSGTAQDAPEVAVEVETPEVPVPKTWEDHLDDILLSDDNENTKADQILALMQTTLPENQEELAQHLVNMVQDDHYEGTSNLLMNLNTQTNVAEVLLNDLLNRNNTLKLNTLLQIVKVPEHPLHENAREMLELFVQEDHGKNYDEWEKAVADWLKENEPEPQAQAQATAPDAPAPQ